MPFSTPRAWALLSRDLDLAEAAGRLDTVERRAITFGRVSPEDAGLFCALAEDGLGNLRPVGDYLRDPSLLPKEATALWFVVSRLRKTVERDELRPAGAGEGFPRQVNALLKAFPQEYLFATLVGLSEKWHGLGGEQEMDAMYKETVFEVTGIEDA